MTPAAQGFAVMKAAVKRQVYCRLRAHLYLDQLLGALSLKPGILRH